MTKEDARFPSSAGVRDVARRAGVSPATVSRVINNPAIVRAKLRAAVSRAMAELSYIPNAAARSLTLRRTQAIGLLVPSIADPIFGPTIVAIESTLSEAGYALLVGSSNWHANLELRQCQSLIERGIDGIILTGPILERKVIRLVTQRNLPFACQNLTRAPGGHPSIRMNDKGAMRSIVQHLIEAGHKRIAVLTGRPASAPTMAERLAGAREAIQSSNLVLSDDWIVESGYDAASAREGTRRILQLRPRPTAIACAGDALALAALTECRAEGLNVPADISITGCNDVDLLQYADPPLTTVDTSFRNMGHYAAQALLNLIHGKPGPMRQQLPFALKLRGTVAPPSDH
jgi:DNA-binding LacI/PurR family transcriptional regulator